jgi:hypothetical protein
VLRKDAENPLAACHTGGRMFSQFGEHRLELNDELAHNGLFNAVF